MRTLSCTHRLKTPEQQEGLSAIAGAATAAGVEGAASKVHLAGEVTAGMDPGDLDKVFSAAYSLLNDNRDWKRDLIQGNTQGLENLAATVSDKASSLFGCSGGTAAAGSSCAGGANQGANQGANYMAAGGGATAVGGGAVAYEPEAGFDGGDLSVGDLGLEPGLFEWGSDAAVLTDIQEAVSALGDAADGAAMLLDLLDFF